MKQTSNQKKITLGLALIGAVAVTGIQSHSMGRGQGRGCNGTGGQYQNQL